MDAYARASWSVMMYLLVVWTDWDEVERHRRRGRHAASHQLGRQQLRHLSRDEILPADVDTWRLWASTTGPVPILLLIVRRITWSCLLLDLSNSYENHIWRRSNIRMSLQLLPQWRKTYMLKVYEGVVPVPGLE